MLVDDSWSLELILLDFRLEDIMRYAIPAAACLLAFSTSPAGAATIIYTLNDPIGSVGSLTGTITTDGFVGILTSANITDYNLNVVGNGASTLLTKANSGALIAGDALIASPTQLTFNFSDANPSYLLVQKSFSSGKEYACAASTLFNSTPCYQGLSAVPESYDSASAQYTGEGAQGRLEGTVVLGTAVPEPATWALMLLGFGLIGFAMRKRSNVRTTVSYA